MSRAHVVISREPDRTLIMDWAQKAPFGTRVEFKGPRRSVAQNQKLWASLTDVARQVEWHGQRLSTEDWKVLFLDALKREHRVVPALEGDGVVDLGRSSSDLSKEEMSGLLELILAFGANHGVVFHDQRAA